MNRDKFIELLGSILKQAITDSPCFEPFNKAVILASDDPKERKQFVLDALEWLRIDVFRYLNDKGNSN